MATLPKITEYAKNIVKSITYSAIDVTKTNMPTLGAYIDQDSNRELAKTIYSGVKDYKGSINKSKTAIKSSRIYESADLGVKSALEDLKTGKFYNRERINAIEEKTTEALFGSFDDIDLEFSFSNEDGTSDISDGDKLIAASSQVSALKSADLIAQTQVKTTDAVIKSQKAGTQALYTQGAHIIGGLKEVAFVGAQTQGSIIALNEIQKTAADNSRKFYESTSKLLQENNNILKEMVEMQRMLYKGQQNNKSKEQQTSFSDMVNYDGAIDLKAYLGNIKKNAKNVLSSKTGGALDLLLGGDANMLNMFAASPLSFISTAMLQAFMPKNVSNASKNFDKTISGVSSTILARLNNMARNEDNPISQLIGSVFGVNTKVKTTLDPSKYNKGAVPFDGVVRKSIVEVIPTYLRRIESAITGTPERIFDPSKGTWTNTRQLKKDYDQIFKSNKANANNDLIEEFQKVLNSKNSPRFDSKYSRDDFTKSLETFLDKLYERDGDYKVKSKEDAYDFGIRQDHFDQIVDMFTNKNNKSMQRARIRNAGQTMSAKNELNRRIQSMEEYGDSPLFQLFNNSTDRNNFKTPDYEEKATVFRGGISLNNQTDKLGHNIFYYLQNMYKELYSIRNNYGLSELAPVGIQRSSNLVIPDVHRQTAREAYHSRNNDARRRYDKQTEAHIRNNGRMYGYETRDNIVKDRNTVEFLNAREQLDNSYNTNGWLNNALYGDRTSLTRLNVEKRKNGLNPIDYNKFTDRIKATKNLSEKLAVLQDQVNRITKAPANQMTKLLEKADARIYEFFYGAETGEEDDEGNKITGFMQLMSMRLNAQFDKFNNFIDTKIFAPIKQKLGVENMKELLDKMGVTKVWETIQTKLLGDKDENGKRNGGILGDTRDEIKRVFGDAKDYVVTSIKDVFSPITNKIKEAWANKPKIFSKNVNPNDITEEMLQLAVSQAEVPTGGNNITTPLTNQLMLPAVINNTTINKAMKRARATYSKKIPNTAIPLSGPVLESNMQKVGGGIMSKISNTLDQILNTINKVVYNNRSVRVHVEPKRYNTTNTPKIFSHASMRRESETEGDSTGDSDGELHSSAFGNSFNKNTTSALSKGEIYGKNGLYGKVPETGVYDVKSGTTIYPTKKNKAIEMAKEQSSISKFISKIKSNANAKNRQTRIIDGKVYNVGQDGKWHRYEKVANGGVVDHVVEEDGFLDQMYSTAKGGLNTALSGLGFSGLANTNAVTNIDSAMEVVKKYAPKMTANGLLGGAIGLLSGNPLLGATIGAVSGYVGASEKAKNMLFGEQVTDEKGDVYRSGGAISKQTQDTIKKYIPNIGKYGVTGAALGLLSPFGVVGGAAIGSAIGWATTNDKIKEALFGNLKDAKSGLINKEIRNKVKKAMPNIAIGALATMIGGPFGLLGNLVLGSGIGFASSTNGFKEAIFGKEEVGEDGNKVRKGGLVGAIKINVVDPLKDFANTFKTKAEDFIINDMINPLNEGIKPIVHEMGLLAKGMVGFIPKTLNKLFESTFGRPLEDMLRDRVISPLAKIGGGAARIGGSIGKKVISAPFKTVGAVGRSLQSKHIRSGNANYISAAERLAFRNDNRGRGVLSNIPIMGNSVFGSLGFNPTGYRDNYKAIDQTLNSMDNPDTIKAAMDAMDSLSRGKGYYKEQTRKTGRSIMTDLSAVFPSSITNRMKKALERNDIRTLSNLIRNSKPIKGTELSVQDREGLIQKSVEGLKTIEENGRKSNLSNEERSNLFGQLNNLGFKNLNDKNIGKVRNMVQTEYELKKNNNEKTPEQKEADKSKDNAKLVSDPITDNATENANNIIQALTSSLDRLAEIQVAALPPSKARKLLNKQHAKITEESVENLVTEDTKDGETLASSNKEKWIFDAAAGKIRKYVKTGDGWEEATGKAKSDADAAAEENQNNNARSLAGSIGSKLKDLLGIGVDEETGENKKNPVVEFLKKTAKFLGMGVVGATAIAGAGHGSQFVKDHIIPGIKSVWSDDIKPFLKEHLGALYDKAANIATTVTKFVSDLPNNVYQTVDTMGDWMMGKGRYKGAGLPYVFETKIFPWYLEGFDKFATIYFPPIVKTFVASLPSLAKGLGKGLWSGIKALVNKDDRTEPDFDTDYYGKDYSKDINIYSRNSTSLNKIKPINGGSGWWNQSSTGLGSIFKPNISSNATIASSSITNRLNVNNEVRSGLRNNTGESRAKYVQQGINNAKEITTDGKVLYNPKFMPKDLKGNTYLPDGSISNDNSKNLFNPFGGAVSLEDRLFKGTGRLLAGAGGKATAFSLLKNTGKAINKVGGLFGPMGRIAAAPVGGGMQLIGATGEKAVKVLPDLGKFVVKGNNVGTIAGKIGSNIAKSKNTAISKIGNNLAESGITKAGKKAAEEAAQTAVDRAAVRAGRGVVTDAASRSLLTKVTKLITEGIQKLLSSPSIIRMAKEGMQAVGKQVTKELAGKTLKEAGENIIKKLVKAATKKLLKAGSKLIAKITTAVGTAGIATVLFAAWDFITGTINARDILGLTKKQDIGVFERFLAGLLKCVNGFATLGLIPEDIIVDIFIEYLAPLFKIDVKNIKERRTAAEEDVKKYNAENGTKYSVEEYNHRNGVWNKIKNAFKGSNVPSKAVVIKSASPRIKYTNQADALLAASKSLNGNNTTRLTDLPTLNGNSATRLTDLPTLNGRGKYGLGRVYQNDPKYSFIPFNKSTDTVRQTIGNSGCGPAAAVNAVNYAYGTGSSLQDAANLAINGGYKEKNGGTNPEFFKTYFNKNGLNANRLNSNSDILNNIQSGSPVVLMGKDPSENGTPYGPNPHYVVGKGVDANGNIIIDDPESIYGTSKYNASKVLNKTSVAIAASKYGRAIAPLNVLSNSARSNILNNNPFGGLNSLTKNTAVSMSKSISDKDKYAIGLRCLPYIDKTFSSLPGSVVGMVNTAVIKAGRTITETDKNKTVRTILSNYLGIKMGEMQDLTSALAKASGMSLGELKTSNPALYSKLKSVSKSVAGLDISTFNNKSVEEISSVIGVKFNGDAPTNVVQSSAAPQNNWTGGLDEDMTSYDSMQSGDEPVKENIFDKISNLVKGFFTYTDKSGNKKSLLDIFGLGGSSSSSEQPLQNSGSLSKQQQLIKSAMGSIIGKNNYSQANRFKVGASLDGANQGSADCSSTTQWALKRAGIDPGGDTAAQITSAAGQWVDGEYKFGDNAKPDANKLALGDLMFYGTSKSRKPNNVSHVEMYWGNKQRIGHGSGIGPRVSPYNAKSSTQQYLGAKRFIAIGSNLASGISNIPGGSVEENKKIIWNYLKNKGYSDIAAAGIMGNIGQESAFKQDAIQNNGRGPGIGLAQWSYSSRKKAFEAAVPDWKTNIGGQLDFMYNEISNSYKSLLPSRLNKASTVEEATKLFHNVYEGSADKVLTRRYAFANTVYSQFGSNALIAKNSANNPFKTKGFINSPLTFGLGKYGLANKIVRNSNISSEFNDPTRLSHKGIDISANKGNPVISPANGVVIRSEYNDTNGNMIVVQSNDGNLHTFAHLDSKKVSQGDKVSIGSIIGTVGSTGNSFGDHVHYQLTNKDGQYVDPLSANKSSNINKPVNNRPIGGGDGIDYTQLIKIIIDILGTISDNTSKFTAALNLISEKTGVDISSVNTSSKDKGLSQIKDKLKALDSSYGRGSDMGSSMMGRGTGYLVEAMSAIARS